MPPPAMDTMALTAAFGAGFSAYAFLTKYFSEDKSDGTVFTEPEKKLLIAKNLSVDEEFNDSVIADDVRVDSIILSTVCFTELITCS